jgi:hypothetical protein
VITFASCAGSETTQSVAAGVTGVEEEEEEVVASAGGELEVVAG